MNVECFTGLNVEDSVDRKQKFVVVLAATVLPAGGIAGGPGKSSITKRTIACTLAFSSIYHRETLLF